MPLCLVLQKATPLAVLGALHFEAITDLAWSSDGSYLAISSYDGFCRQASQSSASHKPTAQAVHLCLQLQHQQTNHHEPAMLSTECLVQLVVRQADA